MELDRVHKAQWVIKTSKLCNLRCNYCYEYAELSDPARISEENLLSLFLNVRDFRALRGATHEFVWHGGEPTLLPTKYFIGAIESQKRIFSPGRPTVNRIQTNLYRLTDEWLDLFKSKLFDSIGVSLDVFGNNRVNSGGLDSSARVLSAVEDLRANDIDFGMICVVHRGNLAYLSSIYEFCVQAKVACRFLPIYKDSIAGQNDHLACAHEEVVTAFKSLCDKFGRMPDFERLEPLGTLKRRIIDYLDGRDFARYVKTRDSNIFIVNTNGDVFGNADQYDLRFLYTNIFNNDLNELFTSEGWKRSVVLSEQKQSRVCGSCELKMVCNGSNVAESTERELAGGLLGRDECAITRPLLAHLANAHVEASSWLGTHLTPHGPSAQH